MIILFLCPSTEICIEFNNPETNILIINNNYIYIKDLNGYFLNKRCLFIILNVIRNILYNNMIIL